MNNTNIPTEDVVDLSPFKAMVMTIGTLPTAFTESMTYYEALAYFVSYIEKTLIPAVNQNAEATKELQKLLVELKEYVDHYFDTLDVQDEINNKLDEMVEDGTLAEIINQEVLDNVKTVTDAILAQNEPFTYHYIYSASNFGNSLFVEGDKNIIVDFGDASGVVDAYLRSRNVTKLDAIIITHYHNDHIGGANAQSLQEVLNDSNIDFSECVAYLPHKGIDWSQYTSDDKSQLMESEATVKAMLTAAGITCVEPDNEQKVDLSELTSLEFFNIGSAFYDNYYGKDLRGLTGYGTDYNAFSMLIKITHNGVSEFETGDAAYLTQKYNAKYLTDIKIYHSFHHGTYTPLHKNWELRLYADYCVTTPIGANVPVDNGDIMCCGVRGARIHNVKEYGHTLKIVQTGTTLKCDADFNAKKNNLSVSTRPLVCLEPGTDLNDLVDDGSYYVTDGEVCATFSNIPPSDNLGRSLMFRLDVIKISSHMSDDDVDLKQILTFGQTGELYSGYWVREKRRYDVGYGKWYYLGVPSYTEDTHSIYGWGAGTISGDGKVVTMIIPTERYIPNGFTISNPIIQALNIKSGTGGVAWANSESQTTYNITVSRTNSGLRVDLRKNDNSSFDEIDVAVAGTITFKITLTRTTS